MPEKEQYGHGFYEGRGYRCILPSITLFPGVQSQQPSATRPCLLFLKRLSKQDPRMGRIIPCSTDRVKEAGKLRGPQRTF